MEYGEGNGLEENSDGVDKNPLPKKFKPPGGEGPVDPRIARAAAKEERQKRRNRRRHPEIFSTNQIKLN